MELLLNAESALALGLLDSAEQTYRSVLAADPRNGIAAVGLSRVALERGDDAGALALAQAALEIDPENATGRRMIDRLEEVARFREAPSARPLAAPTNALADPTADSTVVAPESMIRASMIGKSDPAGASGARSTTNASDPGVPEHAGDEAAHAGGLQPAVAAPPRALQTASVHGSSTDSQRPGPAGPALPMQPADRSGPSAAATPAPPNRMSTPSPTSPARPGLLRRFFRRS